MGATFFPPTTLPAAAFGALNSMTMPSTIPLWRVWLAMDMHIKEEMRQRTSEGAELAQRQ